MMTITNVNGAVYNDKGEILAERHSVITIEDGCTWLVALEACIEAIFTDAGWSAHDKHRLKETIMEAAENEHLRQCNRNMPNR